MRAFLALTFALLVSWLSAPDPAHAGPLMTAVGALVVNLGTVGNAIAALVVNFGFQTLLSSIFAPKEPKEKGTKQKMDNGADKPPKIVMGIYGTPGHLLYHNSFFGTRNIYVQVIILSAKKVNGLSNYVRIAGRTCVIDFGTVDADGFSPVEEYEKNGKQYSKVKFHAGGQTTADPFLVATFGSDPDWAWTNDMIVKGCAYVIVQSLYSRKGVWAGTPDYFWTVDGIPLYDPRRDSTVGGSGAHRWNDESTWGGPGDYNTKVQIYNIIRGIKDIDGSHLWGGRAEAYRLPLDYWFAAMNVCDEDVEKKNGDHISRYQTGLEIELDSEPLDIIKDLDSSCSGFTSEYGGQYKTWCGPAGLSVMTVTDDDFYISDPMKDDLFKPLQETYNSAVATYPEPRSGWSMEPGPRYSDPDFLAADNNEPLVLDIQLPYVTENNQVQRVQREALRESRVMFSHTGTLPPEAYILEPNDRITYISERNGYHGDGVDFLIGSKEDHPDVRQVVTIRAVNPNAFLWLKEEELDHTVGHMGVIKPGALDVAFSLAPDTIDNGSGPDKPAISVTWDWADLDVDVDRVIWQLRRHGTTKVLDNGAIHHVWDGEATIASKALRFKHSYDVRFQAMPISDRESDWTVWQQVDMVDLSKPAAPTLSAQSFVAGDGTLDYYLKADWASVSGEVSYKVEVTEITDGSAVRVYPAENSHYKLRVTSGGQFSVRIATKAADGGTQSDWSNPTTITINPKTTAPTASTGLTLVASFRELILSWPRQTDKDYAATRVYRSNVNDFTTASLVHEKAGTGWTDGGLPVLATRYYWITHLDRHGNESAKYPLSNTAGVNGTTTAIADTDTDGTSPATPTGLAVTPRTNLNGDGKVDVEMVVTFTGIANKKATYIVRVEDVAAGTFDQHYLKDLGSGGATAHRKVIPALSGTAYNISVAAVSGTGSTGAFTANVNVTPSKKTLLPTAPTSLVAIGKHGRVVLKSNRSPDSDYRRTNIYASNINDFATATKIDMVNSTKFDESDLGNAVTRYYWITFEDRSGNESNKYPASNTAGVSATTVYVGDGDTDPTAPNTPAGLSIGAGILEILEDGTAQAHTDVSWTAVVAGVPVKSYIVKVTQVSNGKVRYFPADTNSVSVEVKTGKSYNYQVASVNAFGKESAYSSAVAFTRAKKAGSTIPTPTSLTIAANAKRNKIDWTDVDDDTYPDYRNTAIWRNTVNTTPVPGTTPIYKKTAAGYYVDDNLAIGQVYYYWIAHRDKSGLFTSLAGPVSSSATALAGADLADGAVGSSKLGIGVGANQIKNSDMVAGLTNWVIRSSNNLAEFAFGLRADTYAPSPGALQTYHENGVTTEYVDISPADADGAIDHFTVVPNSWYEASVYFLGHRYGNAQLYLEWFTSADVHISYSLIDSQTTPRDLNPSKNLSSYGRMWGKAQAPATAAYCTVFFRHLGTIAGAAPADSYVWWHKAFFAECVANQSEPTPWSAAAVTIVADGHTSQTAPNTPASLGVAAGILEILEDGTAQAHTDVSWTAVVSGVPVKSYIVKVTQVSNGKVRYFPADTNSVSVEVKTGKSYNYQVASVNAFGKLSAYSSAVAYTRAKKAGSTIPTPTSLTIAANSKRNKLDWADVDDDTYPDYRNTAIWRSTVNTTPVPGTTPIYKKTSAGYYVDDNLAIGQVYYYWIAHRDKSGLFTSLAGPVNSAATTLAGSDLASGAVGARELAAQNWANLMLNGSFAQNTLEPWYGRSDLTIVARGGATAPVNALPTPFALKVPSTSGASDAVGADWFDVGPGDIFHYKFDYAADAGTTGNLLLQMRWMKDDGTTGPVGLATLTASTTIQTAQGQYEIPANVVKLWAGLRTLNGGVGNWYVTKCRLTRIATTELLDDGAVTDGKTDQTAPDTPAPPSVAIGILEVLDDGAVQAHTDVSWTAVSTGVPVKSYLVKVTQVSNGKVRYFPSDTNSVSIEVKTGKAYNYQVAAVNAFGKIGGYSSATSYTRPKKSGSVPAGGTLLLTALKRRLKIDWPDVDDDTFPDYRITYIYRNTTGIAPTLGTTAAYKKTKAGYFVDEGVTTGTMYYYWIAHKDNSGQFGAISAVVSGVSAGNEVTGFSDLTGVAAASQIDQDVISNNLILDSDFDSGSTSLWSGAAGVLTNVAATDAPGGGRALQFDRNVTDSSVSMNRAYANLIPVVGGDVYYAEFTIKTDAAAPSAAGAYLRMIFYDASGALIAGGNGVGYRDFYGNGAIPVAYTTFSAQFALPATAKYVRPQIFHHSTSTVENMFVASVKVLRALTDDHTDQTPPATPSAPIISQTNKDLNGDRTVDMGLKLSVAALPSGAKSIVFKIEEYQSNGTTLIDTWYEYPKKLVKRFGPVIAGHVYKVSAAGVAFNDVEGAFSSVTSFTPTGKTGTFGLTPNSITFLRLSVGVAVLWNNTGSGDDYDFTRIFKGSTTTFASASKLADTSMYVTGAGLSNTGFWSDMGEQLPNAISYYWVQNFDKSGNGSSVYGPISNAGCAGIDQGLINANAVSAYSEAITAGNIALAAATETEIQSFGVDFTDCYGVLIFHAFANNDGTTARSFDIKLYDNTTQIDARSGNLVSNGGLWSDCFFYSAPASGVRTLRLKLTCANATNVNGRRLRVLKLKR